MLRNSLLFVSRSQCVVIGLGQQVAAGGGGDRFRGEVAGGAPGGLCLFSLLLVAALREQTNMSDNQIKTGSSMGTKARVRLTY